MSQMNLPAMTRPRSRCAAASLIGKLFVVGGYGGGDDGWDSIEYYDVDERKWTRFPSNMRHGREGCAAVAIGNSIYVAGGSNVRGSFLDSMEEFNINSGLWRTLSPMRTRRYGCAGVAVGDEFFVIGGMDGSYTCRRTAESFDVRTTGEWEFLVPMDTARSDCAATAVNNKIYVVGGNDGGSVLDTIEVFDLTTRTWTLLPHRMKTKRWGCCVTAVAENLIIVAGGYDGNSALNTVEMYDIEAGTCTELPPMTTKRLSCASVALGGSIYVVGGSDGPRSLDSVEEMSFNDDVMKGMLVEWRGGSWSSEVAPLLRWRTSVVHRMDLDLRLMPTLLSSVSQEGRVQTVFAIVRGGIYIFKHTWDPKQQQNLLT